MSDLDPAEVFKVLGGRTRMAILRILRHHGPLGAVRLAELLGVSTAAVSQHLRVLRQTGLVEGERDGYHVPYHVKRKRLHACLDSLGEVCGMSPGPELMLNRMKLEELRRYREHLLEHLRMIEERIRELSSETESAE